MQGLRVGRILTDAERDRRRAGEDAAGWEGEQLRSAFAISGEHVLTAWHCVRDLVEAGEALWVRLRASGPGQAYVYVPVRLVCQDPGWDVAVLGVDRGRRPLPGVLDAAAVLADAVVPLGIEVGTGDRVQVAGFPANAATSADHDVDLADVADVALPFGAVQAMKLTGTAFAAVDPVDPHGLSGGPVLSTDRQGGLCAVGVVRAVPRGQGQAALGGSLVATRIEDVAGLLPQVAQALLPEARPHRGPGERSVSGDVSSLVTMLRADAAVVDFFGRGTELDILTTWCVGEPSRAAGLMTGPGGQGKTRLARHVMQELTGRGGWAAVVVRGPGEVDAVRDLLRRARAAGHAVLVVVDYAAEYGAAALAGLVTVMTAADVGGCRWRMLLLARFGGDWWQPEGSSGAAVVDRRFCCR